LIKWGGDPKYTFEHSSIVMNNDFFKAKLKQYNETRNSEYHLYLRQHYNRNCKLNNDITRKFDFSCINDTHHKVTLISKELNDSRLMVIKKYFEEILTYNVYYIHNSFAMNNIYSNLLIPLMTTVIPYEKKVFNKFVYQSIIEI